MIHIRDATEKDLSFITSSFMQSYYPQSSLGFDEYKHFQNKLVKNLLKRSFNIIACDDIDKDLIFGYCIHDLYMNDAVIHYIYVKALYRRMNISKQLMKEALNDREHFYYTHKPEQPKILKSLTYASGEYCEHLRYGDFYEET
jgi:ribosomal protein S18 acetylase RimI-like enzyme